MLRSLIPIIQSLTCFCRGAIVRRRLKFYNSISVSNTSSLISTQKHSPTAILIDPIYTIEDETINKSTICPISSNDEKGKDLSITIISI
jgi:hypothetical protein